jgi:hypothetical protein
MVQEIKVNSDFLNNIPKEFFMTENLFEDSLMVVKWTRKLDWNHEYASN